MLNQPVPPTSLNSRLRGLTGARMTKSGERGMSLLSQIISQLLLLLIAVSVLYPILWVVSMSFDPRDISRPTELRLNPSRRSGGSVRDPRRSAGQGIGDRGGRATDRRGQVRPFLRLRLSSQRIPIVLQS